MRVTRLLLSALFVCPLFLSAQESIDLSGEWQFQIDRGNEGVAAKWHSRELDDRIVLPASMPQRLKGDVPTVRTRWTGSLYDSSFFFNPKMAQYREDGKLKLPFFLTPDRHYVGVVWYRRTVNVPKNWKGNNITLRLERPHITSTLYVNGVEVGSRNSLCVAHAYDVTKYLVAGKPNTIALRIDNKELADVVGQDSHSVTDQTQGNWNGVVGRMELVATPAAYIDQIKVFPDVKNQRALVRTVIRGKAVSATLKLQADLFNMSGVSQSFALTSQAVSLKADSTLVETVYDMKECFLWDEFAPALYRLTATLDLGKQKHTLETTFGMRDFKVVGDHFEVNGREVMLRGTVENCDFPLTGYAPTDLASWLRVFGVCKKYGLNHMRFHSYCPPEAAFEAADMMGFYLQPEGPSWPNHGVKLGNNMPIDKYLMEETRRINDEYGNHPSFCMLACGNEPAGAWVKWVSEFVDYWKAADSRHVYTGASVGGGWAWQPKNQYHVKAGARGLNEWGNKYPESTVNFKDKLDTLTVPFVSHETGQWCAFPNFDETEKYTGPYKAKNFEIFRDLMAQNGMADMNHKFLMASGKLQLLCYKFEIERTLRTPGYDGFQLLGLNDYSGQGTALVGLLDVFFDEKGYADANDFKEFCAPTVVMARIPKFTYFVGDTLKAAIEVAHFGHSPIKAPVISYCVEDEFGQVVNGFKHSAHRQADGNALPDIKIGNAQQLLEIAYPVGNEIAKAQKLTLRISIDGVAANHYDFWVYPKAALAEAGDVLMADSLTDEVVAKLKAGGKVLLCAGGKVAYGKGISQYFTPVFWNTSWFKMRPPHTTGAYIRENHPIFRDFPTSYHSDLQWWSLLNRQPVMLFSEFPADFQPIVQSIDTWFLSRKIGMLYEANVLGGRLVMTTLPLTAKKFADDPAVSQMLASILAYMNRPDFKPGHTIDYKFVENLFTKQTPPVNMFTKDTPDELKPGYQKKNK